MPAPRVRVIMDPPLSAVVNMSRDEVLLARVGRGESPPTLRFYQWHPPAVSLGYFQKFADFQQLAPPAGELDVVRRLTGGGAILHDRELTYSITVPLGHELLKDGPNKLYELVHDAVIDVLRDGERVAVRCGASDDSGAAKGPFFCFARRHFLDVLVGADKLAGSAQRRTRHAVLQHGSIILERRFKQQPAAALSAVTPLTATELAQKMTNSMQRLARMDFHPGKWESAELAAAEAALAKYASNEWTKRR